MLYCFSEDKKDFVVLRKSRIVIQKNHIKYFFPNSESKENDSIYCLLWGHKDKNTESYGIGGIPVPDDFSIKEFQDRMKFINLHVFSESVNFYFDDGGLFWGHTIEVTVNQSLEFIDANIVG